MPVSISAGTSDPLYDSDIEDPAGAVAAYTTGSSRRLNLDFRPLLSSPVMRGAHPRMRQAMTYVDQASVFVGRWITSRPTLRLGVLTYVLILHLVALTLFSFGRHCGAATTRLTAP